MLHFHIIQGESVQIKDFNIFSICETQYCVFVKWKHLSLKTALLWFSLGNNEELFV